MSYGHSHFSPVMNVMVNTVRKASRHLIRDFGEVERLQVSQKGPQDFVSAADKRSEDMCRRELSRARAGYHMMLEESGVIPGDTDSEWTWVVDPLDGTTNFLHSFPHFCVSIGLLKAGVPFAGVIYDPLRDDLFWAERGLGAFLNSQRLRVAARRSLAGTLLGLSHTHLEPARPGHGFSFRCTGSAALDLAYVAAGRIDGFVGYGLAPWDVAAGHILTQEAGGMVRAPDDLYGLEGQGKKGYVLASNAGLMTSVEALRDVHRARLQDQ